MGHCIEYLSYPKKTTKAAILKDVGRFAYDPWETNRYHGNLTFHEDKVYENEDAAHEAIEKMDRGCYDDHAVLYKRQKKPSEKMKELRNKYEAVKRESAEYAEKHSVKARKSEFIGCPKCGSKLSRAHLKFERCPLCGTRLQADYIIERLAKYEKQAKNILVAMDNEMEKNCDIMWLVKVEWHC